MRSNESDTIYKTIRETSQKEVNTPFPLGNLKGFNNALMEISTQPQIFKVKQNISLMEELTGKDNDLNRTLEKSVQMGNGITPYGNGAVTTLLCQQEGLSAQEGLLYGNLASDNLLRKMFIKNNPQEIDKIKTINSNAERQSVFIRARTYASRLPNGIDKKKFIKEFQDMYFLQWKRTPFPEENMQKWLKEQKMSVAETKAITKECLDQKTGLICKDVDNHLTEKSIQSESRLAGVESLENSIAVAMTENKRTKILNESSQKIYKRNWQDLTDGEQDNLILTTQNGYDNFQENIAHSVNNTKQLINYIAPENSTEKQELTKRYLHSSGIKNDHNYKSGRWENLDLNFSPVVEPKKVVNEGGTEIGNYFGPSTTIPGRLIGNKYYDIRVNPGNFGKGLINGKTILALHKGFTGHDTLSSTGLTFLAYEARPEKLVHAPELFKGGGENVTGAIGDVANTITSNAKRSLKETVGNLRNNVSQGMTAASLQASVSIQGDVSDSTQESGINSGNFGTVIKFLPLVMGILFLAIISSSSNDKDVNAMLNTLNQDTNTTKTDSNPDIFTDSDF